MERGTTPSLPRAASQAAPDCAEGAFRLGLISGRSIQKARARLGRFPGFQTEGRGKTRALPREAKKSNRKNEWCESENISCSREKGSARNRGGTRSGGAERDVDALARVRARARDAPRGAIQRLRQGIARGPLAKYRDRPKMRSVRTRLAASRVAPDRGPHDRASVRPRRSSGVERVSGR